MHTGRLVLAPTDPHALPDRARLTESLDGAEFIGARIDDADGLFRVGPRFLTLISFTGCAVALPSAREANGSIPLCHISIASPSVRPRFLHGRNSRPPRCPQCRTRLVSWNEHAKRWTGELDTLLHCERCDATMPPWRWDWKRQAGFGRLFVSIEEVFPDEALPAAELLELMSRASGSEWDYFYVQD